MMTKCTLRTLPQTATWRSLNTVTNEIPARSAAADTTMIVLSAVIVPQIILRSVPSGANSADIAAAAAVAVLSLLAAFLGATWVGRLVPRRLSYQIVASHIGPGMGVVAASARYLCYVIVIVLGVGVATTSLVEVFPALPRGPLLYGLVLALALPVLLRRGRESRLYWVTAALGAIAIATVLVWGLVVELSDGSTADAAMSARRQAVLSGRNPGVSHPLMTAVMAAVFPACLLVLLSERVHGGARFGVHLLVLALGVVHTVLEAGGDDVGQTHDGHARVPGFSDPFISVLRPLGGGDDELAALVEAVRTIRCGMVGTRVGRVLSNRSGRGFGCWRSGHRPDRNG